MRRVVVIVGVLVTCLGLFPARADAFWWNWIDDLSGPSFGGTTFNWRVWCQTDSDAPTSTETRRRALRVYQSQIKGELTALKALIAKTNTGSLNPVSLALSNALLNGAQTSLLLAEKAMEMAVEQVEIDSARSNAYLTVAIALRVRADLAVDYSQRVEKLTLLQFQNADVIARELAGLTTVDALLEQYASVKPESVGPNIDIDISLCSLDPTKKTRSFLSANIGYGRNNTKGPWPFKKARGTDYTEDTITLVTLGLSYHAVVAPYLTIGTGGGLAFFTTEDATVSPLKKFYVEPYIIDFKPARIWSDDWRAGIFGLRFNSIIYPTGFSPGSFQRTTPTGQVASERLRAELVKSVGLHIDLEPLLKRAHSHRSKSGS